MFLQKFLDLRIWHFQTILKKAKKKPPQTFQPAIVVAVFPGVIHVQA